MSQYTLTRPLKVYKTGKLVPEGTKVVLKRKGSEGDPCDPEASNIYEILDGLFAGESLHLIPNSRAEQSLESTEAR